MLRDVPAEKFSEGMTVEDKTKMLVLERLWMNEGIRHEWQSVGFFFFFSLPHLLDVCIWVVGWC